HDCDSHPYLPPLIRSAVIELFAHRRGSIPTLQGGGPNPPVTPPPPVGPLPPFACAQGKTKNPRAPSLPGFAAGKLIVIKRLRLHLDAISGIQRSQIASLPYRHRIDEVLMQMVDIFRDAILERRAHRDVIEKGKVLHVFTEPHAAGV